MANAKRGWLLYGLLGALVVIAAFMAYVELTTSEPPVGHSVVQQLPTVPASYPTADQAVTQAGPIMPSTADAN